MTPCKLTVHLLVVGTRRPRRPCQRHARCARFSSQPRQPGGGKGHTLHRDPIRGNRTATAEFVAGGRLCRTAIWLVAILPGRLAPDAKVPRRRPQNQDSAAWESLPLAVFPGSIQQDVSRARVFRSMPPRRISRKATPDPLQCFQRRDPGQIRRRASFKVMPGKSRLMKPPMSSLRCLPGGH